MRLKFPRKFAQKQRAYKSPESILSHDAGNAGARALIERFQGNPPSVEAIDVWLEGINDMLGSGEFSLEEANACLLRLQEAWEDFRRQ